MWPAGGTYAPWQRELLQFVLEWRNAVLPRIRPGVTTDAILAEARAAMEPVLARTRFSKPEYEKAARKMLETSGGAFSHPVGMAVHDVGGYRDAPLRPGQVFALDVKVGDTVLLGKYSGSDITVAGKDYVILREEEVLGVVEGVAELAMA